MRTVDAGATGTVEVKVAHEFMKEGTNMKYTYIVTRILGKTEIPFCKIVGDTKKCVFAWLKDIEAKNVIHQKTGTNTSRLEYMWNGEKYICIVRRVKN